MPYESTSAARPPVRSTRAPVHPTRPRSVRKLLRLEAPLHPVLVHFTVALTVIAFGFDFFAFVFDIRAWSSIGWWNLAAAVAVTAGTLATGVKSRLQLPLEEGEARSFLRVHMALGPVVFGLLLMLAFWRARLWQASSGVTWPYLVVMFLVLLIVGVQGYLGGELVYRYGASVSSGHRELPRHHGRTGSGERRSAGDDDDAASGGRSRRQS